MAHADFAPIRPAVPTQTHKRIGVMIAAAGAVLAGLLVLPDMLAYRGELLIHERRWSEAVLWLDRAQSLAPLPEVFQASQAQIYADWATAAGDESIWRQGAAVYANLVQTRPDVVEYHRRQGTYLLRWYVSIHDPSAEQQAITAYDAAIRLSPRDPDLWLDRGLIRVQAGDSAGALADFEQARSLLNDYSRIYGAMSIYALSVGDVTAAQEWNRRALDAQREWDDWVWRR